MTQTEVNLLNNEEHREAIQANITSTTKAKMAGYGEEYLRKYEIIEEVMQKLTENEIRSIVWCFMPSNEHGTEREMPMYFQNLSNFIKWEKGKASKESMKTMSYQNHMAVLGYLTWFRSYIMTNPHTIADVFPSLSQILDDAYNWFSTGNPPPHITKLLDE